MAVKRGIKELVAAAEAEIETLTPEEAKALHGDDDVVFVDLRDIRELWREGAVPGAYHAPRGMLEFWVDPESPYHKDIFAQDKRFVLFCAGGMRSALAAKTMQDMGIERVCHIAGGYAAWRENGGQTEAKEPPKPKE